MVCTANELLEWKDFPKGLRVLLLDEDHDSASEIKSKLEQMQYLVTTICSEHEALSTISNKNDVFHVAIVEVSTQNSDGRYKLLEAAKDLPTIMTSKEHCLSTMMKCIALGAVEFLTKPLSEDKLRNIWQHVVHKAFNASGNAASESPKSVKEFVGSVLEIQHQNTVLAHNQASEGPEEISQNDNENEHSSNSDKFPAPSTPQLKHGGRSFDHGDCQDQTKTTSPLKESGELDGEITKSVDITYGDSNAKMEVDPPDQPNDNVVIKEEKTTSPLKESVELDGEITKSVDITYGDSNANMEVYPPDQPIDNDVIKEENDTSDCSQRKDDTSSIPLDKDVPTKGCDNNTGKSNTESTQNSCGAKANRKKIKVDWTPELHKKFVQAVEKLGVDQAIPSRILELMKVEGLTRHNVASHLQKYRMNRRHILPKEENRRWPHPRDSMQRSCYPHRPVIAYPPYQTNHTMPPGHVYPVWGPQHGVQPPHLPMWGSPPSYPWQPVENWHWQPYPGMHAEAWGCPVLPPPPCPSSNFPHQVQGQGTYGFNSPDGYGIRNSSDPHPGEEVIDKVVKEAISKPWLPLPIGLKPPSTDSVLAELSRQGISTVPPHLINGRHPC